jgi:hypothetical protein
MLYNNALVHTTDKLKDNSGKGSPVFSGYGKFTRTQF